MNWVPLLPELIIALAGFVVLFIGIFVQNYRTLAWISGVFAVASILLILYDLAQPYSYLLLWSSVQVTRFANVFNLLFLISLLFTLSASVKEKKDRPEIFYALLLFATFGMMLVSFSNNLIMIFVAFEAASIATYALSGYNKEKGNVEASMKFFVIGALSSAFLVFGISYLFLASNSFEFITISKISNSYALLGLAFLVVGFGFKMAMFPFHSWAVDTYTGSRATIASYLSTASKLMALIAMIHIFIFAFASMGHYVYVLFALLSVFTMTYGNVVALVQQNVKRMLAYSSIANAGYLSLIFAIAGFTNSPEILAAGLAAVAIFSIAYVLMKGGMFISLTPFEKSGIDLDSFAGLGRKKPVFAFSIALLLMSLAGIPPTLGFVGKYYLFLTLIEANLIWLAIFGIINSAISVFYYFKVIMQMFWKTGGNDVKVDWGVAIPVVGAAAAVLIIGILSPYLIGFLQTLASHFISLGGW